MKVEFFNNGSGKSCIIPNMIYNRCDLWATKKLFD